MILSRLCAARQSCHGPGLLAKARLTLFQKTSPPCAHFASQSTTIRPYSAKAEEDRPDTPSQARAKHEQSPPPQDKQQSTASNDTLHTKSFEASLQEKEDRYKELHKSYLVTLADMENLRMRTKKEVENSATYSITKLAKELLSVVDVLELALAAVPAHLRPAQPMEEPAQGHHHHHHAKAKESLASLYTGVELTLHELLNVLKRNGIEGFEALNMPFDPNCHMALYDVPCSADQSPGMVVDVQKKGYKLKDRILRPAQVGITKS